MIRRQRRLLGTRQRKRKDRHSAAGGWRRPVNPSKATPSRALLTPLLAELKPKLMEEIAKKMGRKRSKKAAISRQLISHAMSRAL